MYDPKAYYSFESWISWCTYLELNLECFLSHVMALQSFPPNPTALAGWMGNVNPSSSVQSALAVAAASASASSLPFPQNQGNINVFIVVDILAVRFIIVVE